MPSTENTICSSVPPRENQASSTNTSTNYSSRATTHYRIFLVHLARRNFQGSCVQTPTPEGARRMGPGEHRCQMQNAPLRQTLVIVCKGRLHNNVDAQVENHWPHSKPHNANGLLTTIPYIRQYNFDMA